MKIWYGGGYYLQKFDLALINHHIASVPACFAKEREKWAENLEIHDDYYVFVGPFVRDESISWIDSLDFVVSYDEYNGVPMRLINKAIREEEKEIQRLEASARKVRWRWGKSQTSFEDTPNAADVENLRAIYREIRQIDRKLAALELLRDQQEGMIRFEFPVGYNPTPPHMTERRSILKRLFGHYRAP